MDCWTCQSNSGARRISPGPTIWQGAYWRVEHAYPVAITGWLVIVLNRHAEALHDLTPAEFAELAHVQARLTRLLHEQLGCEKEYLACYAEAEHFAHIHFHVLAKPKDLPDEFKGGRSFALLKPTEASLVAPEAIQAFCEHWRELLA
ncbi:MAG: hypothetical protein JNK29_03230 [Anaerolineales bacterium]|nr:hypothetical protein [Anaerolineales bacterium]